MEWEKKYGNFLKLTVAKWNLDNIRILNECDHTENKATKITFF